MNAFECMQANTRICYHIMIVTKCLGIWWRATSILFQWCWLYLN